MARISSLKLFSTLLALVIIFSLTLQTSSLEQTESKSSGGFSIKLIHRASNKSPFFEENSLSSTLLADPSGAYMINISIGTPPKFQLAAADTGSALIWIQCQPCVQCYKQDSPIFDPINSSTYNQLPCQSPNCFFNGCDGSQCSYYTSYVDGSFSQGNMASDNLSLYGGDNNVISFPNIVFGCAHKSKLAQVNPKFSGIVGLGFSPASLISQTSSTFGDKFSFCFVPLSQLNVSSVLTFGDINFALGSPVSGTIISTPLLVKPPQDPYYFLTLLGITIGNVKLDFFVNSTNTRFHQNGNIVIDSGTTYTSLPTPFYYQLQTVVKEAIQVEPVGDSNTSLCYEDLQPTDVPQMIMHFLGADLSLSMDNIMTPKYAAGVCLGFRPTENQAFFGNMQHTNFIVGYDLQKMLVSFQATDCTKLVA